MLSAFVVSIVLQGGIFGDEGIIARGDANHSGAVDVSDASYLNNWLFNGGPEPPCMNEADANHDGVIDVSDSIYLLNWLYNGGAAPPAPGPHNATCTTSAEPVISCYAGC